MNFPEAVPIGETHVAQRLSRHAGYDFFRNVFAKGLRSSVEGEDIIADGHTEWWRRITRHPHNLILGLHAGSRVDGQINLVRKQGDGYGSSFHTELETLIPESVSRQNPQLAAEAIPAIAGHCGEEFGSLVVRVRPSSGVIAAIRDAGFEYVTDRRESSTLTLVRQVR
jgi:hypothetical protein